MAKIQTYAYTHTNTKYIYKHIFKHVTQPHTPKQTQKPNTDTLASSIATIRAHAVRPTTTQKHMQTPTQT